MTLFTDRNRIYAPLAILALAALLAFGWTTLTGAHEGSSDAKSAVAAGANIPAAAGSDGESDAPYNGP